MAPDGRSGKTERASEEVVAARRQKAELRFFERRDLSVASTLGADQKLSVVGIRVQSNLNARRDKAVQLLHRADGILQGLAAVHGSDREWHEARMHPAKRQPQQPVLGQQADVETK
jgi:hypothetical protein